MGEFSEARPPCISLAFSAGARRVLDGTILAFAREDGDVHVMGRGVAEPVEIATIDAKRGAFPNLLVRTEAYLVESSVYGGTQWLILQAGKTLFTARLPLSNQRDRPILPQKGDLLELDRKSVV